jgi:hypothetical protein
MTVAVDCTFRPRHGNQGWFRMIEVEGGDIAEG